MWDSNVDGYARGEGFAAVILKPLCKAVADGDHIECVIRETGVNQDGRTKGITMPSSTAQAALMRSVYKRCGLDLGKNEDRPQYFEAHGTGTPAGDPIEAEAVQSVFFPNGQNPHGSKLHVGSIKTVIGHLEGAAGLAGLLKASLAMQHGFIPPNMHFNNLNPKVAPFYDHLIVPTELTPWPTQPDNTPRRASINSFGFGGTNSHVILEGWVPISQRPLPKKAITDHIGPFILSANSAESVTAAATALSKQLKEQHDHVNLFDVGYTLTKRGEFGWKSAVSASTKRDQLIKKLNTVAPTRALPVSMALPPRILGVFTGQGAQWPTMGAKLYTSCHLFRVTFQAQEEALRTLPDGPSWSLSEQLLASNGESRVHEAAISQPLCTALQVALVDLLKACGIEFSAVVGHSSGEIAAAYAAGYLKAKDAVRIAYYRGVYARLADDDNGNRGNMMAVGLTFDEATTFCHEEHGGRIVVAASNSRSSVTLSGDADAIEEARRILDERNIFARVLKIDTAYHSHHMLKCAEPYLASLKQCNIQILEGPYQSNWYSSVHGSKGRSISGTEPLKGSYWVDNMVGTVFFSEALQRAVVEEHVHDAVLEIGGHPSLKGPALEMLKSLTSINLPYSGVLSRGQNDMDAFSDALGFLWTNFLADKPIVDFDSFRQACLGEEHYQPAITDNIPSYQWDHSKILWKESRKSKAFRTRCDPIHELLGTAVVNGQKNQEVRWRQIMKLNELEWLRGHIFQGQVLFPAAGYIALAFEAAIRLTNEPLQMVELNSLSIYKAITLDEDSVGTEVTFIIRITDRTVEQITAEYSCYSGNVDGSSQDAESTNFSGSVVLHLGKPSADVLPKRVESQLPMDFVDTDRLYSVIQEISGLNYSGDFRVDSVKRRLNASTVTVKRIKTSPWLVHPATLDAAFHSIFAAFSWPGDGRLWTTYLPTSIETVRINMANRDLEEGLVADCNVIAGDASIICGDIDVFCEASGQAEIQVRALTCSSFAIPGPEDDRKLFSRNVWIRDVSSGLEPESKIPASQPLAELSELCERSAYFYCRRLREQIFHNEMQAMEWNHKHLMTWILTHLLPKIEAGEHDFVKREWASDTLDMVKAWKEAYPGQIDLELINAVGQNLSDIVRGKVPGIQILMENNMLGRLYTEGLGFQEANNDLALAAAQLTHRYPRMKVLEIGAGTGGATRHVLKATANHFSSYTYTDISAGFFEEARTIFDEYANKMTFQMLNIEKDPKMQGFTEQYDLIIASNVLHATQFLENTMANCRSLLKPGGHILLLEITSDSLRPQFIVSSLSGWFLGIEDGRIWTPTISEGQWDALLKKVGFSGVDSNTRTAKETSSYFFSVMTSQAVDDRVEVLRKPLVSQNAPRVENLFIVGGTTAVGADTALKIQRLLTSHAANITHIPELEEFQSKTVQIPYGSSIICLADLDGAVFKGMNENRFQAVHKLFTHARHFLWVTQGCQEDEPFGNMIVGLGRSLLLELSDLKLQFLDLETMETPNSQFLAESFIRLLCSDRPEYEDVFWSTEHEIVLKKGAVYIPRILPNETLNNRLNSTRRMISHATDPNEKKPVELVSLNGQLILQLAQISTDQGAIRVQVSLSSANRFTTSDGRSVVCSVGTDIESGKTVLVLCETNKSVLSVHRSQVFEWAEGGEDPENFHHFLTALVAESVVTDIKEHLWIHQPDESLVDAIIDASKRFNINIYLTTSAKCSNPALNYIHPYITRKDLDAIKPEYIETFMNMQQPAQEPLDKTLRSFITADFNVREIFRNNNGQKSIVLQYDESNLHKLIKLHAGTKQKAVNCSAVVFDVDKISSASADSLLQPNTIINWRAAETIPIKIQPIDHSRLLSANKTYLLFGLAGDLGLSVTEWMVNQGARHVVVTSRNPKVHPTVLANLKRKGADIRIMALDITDKAALAGVHREICSNMPPIGGVANGAMVLRDKSFENMTWEDFEVVLRPKVQGSKNLDDLFYSTDLEFFILFSSLACIVGNSGQSNYGAANMFMTSLAYQRRKRGVAASIIHIAMMLGVGYVARSVKQYEAQLKKYKYMALSETDFHEIFAEAIVAGRPHSTAEIELVTGLGQDAKAAWHKNPRFAHYVNGESLSTNDKKRKQQGGSANVRGHVAAAENDEEALAALERGFIKALSNMLQIDAEKIDEKTPLVAMGIDSLVAVQIRSWFLKELGIDFPVLKILNDASPADLCKDALASLLAEEHGEVQVSTQGPAAAESVVVIDWAQEKILFTEGLKRKPRLGSNGSTYSYSSGTTTPSEADMPSKLSVVMTGATGFLGKKVLRGLLANSRVKEVHCIAIRRSSNGSRRIDIDDRRIIEYSGDLTDPTLGLSASEFQLLSETADVIIHNAADVSFLKSYHAVRQINVFSTRTLVEMAIPRSVPVHFVSTAAVALFCPEMTLPEISASHLTPGTDGVRGYASSKWASEVLLEQASAEYGVPAFIHRAVNIVGEGAPDTDLMTVLNRYSSKLHAVPKLDANFVHGDLDIVDVEDVAEGIVAWVLGAGRISNTDSAVSDLSTESDSGLYKVLNYCNDNKVKAPEIKKYYEEKLGLEIAEWPLESWLDRASELGLNVMVEFFLRDSFKSGKPIMAPCLRKGNL